MSIEIKEPFGWANGHLVANASTWKIVFYLPGPDLRYNPQWFEVTQPGAQKLIKEYRTAFDRYQTLKSVVPKTAEMTEVLGDLTIRIGGFANGVCMKSYHNPVGTEAELLKLLALLKRALDRGPSFVKSAKALQVG